VCVRAGVCVCACVHTQAHVCVYVRRVCEMCVHRVCARGGEGEVETLLTGRWSGCPAHASYTLKRPPCIAVVMRPSRVHAIPGRGKDRQGGELAGACTRVCARACVWRLAGAACHPTALCVRAHKQPEHQSCLPAWRPCHAHMHGRMPQQCMRRPIRPTRIPLHCTHDSPACAH
jgi:hypothetical protein